MYHYALTQHVIEQNVFIVVVVGTSQIGSFSRRFYYMGACLLSFLFKQVLTCAFLCASVITSVYEAVVELRV